MENTVEKGENIKYTLIIPTMFSTLQRPNICEIFPFLDDIASKTGIHVCLQLTTQSWV